MLVIVAMGILGAILGITVEGLSLVNIFAGSMSGALAAVLYFIIRWRV